VRLFTIGFTQKPAERFFNLLRERQVRQLVDIRLNPDGQLSGFAKRADLPYFLDRLVGCTYRHVPSLAPTSDILAAYRSDRNWDRYVERFEALMDQRDVPASIDRDVFETHVTCLLCSEHQPERCHRRLVAERVARAWTDVEIVHLG